MLKTNSKTRNLIVRIVSYLFVLLFVYAAVSKLLDFNTFRNQLGQSTVLSMYAEWLVWAVPLLEIIISILLVIEHFRLIGLYGFCSLMIMFTTYILIILNFSPYIPCSCGGVLETLSWTEHLLFNFFFIMLSILLIFLEESRKNTHLYKSSVKIASLVILNSSIVFGLYFNTDTQSKRNNAFVRNYIPHPLKRIGSFNLNYNTYYIAGMVDKSIYLGNYVAPLSLKKVDTSLSHIETFQVSIDSMHLPYRKVKISIHPPYFYVGDGTIPILFRGKNKDWEASIYSYDEVFFTDFVVQNRQTIGFSTISSKTKSKILGALKPKALANKIKLNTSILKEQGDGLFDTDGILLWNQERQEFLYPYFYRNAYEIADQNLKSKGVGKTIDTISQAVLDIAHYKTQGKYKKGGNSIQVNLHAATFGDYLYIHSERLGKYEDEEILESAAIIDVYDLRDNTYAFSFYVYHQADKKLREFKIYNNLLVALVGDTLWLYRLKPKYFTN